MKRLTRVFVSIAAIALVASLAACGSGGAATTTTAPGGTTTTAAPAAATSTTAATEATTTTALPAADAGPRIILGGAPLATDQPCFTQDGQFYAPLSALKAILKIDPSYDPGSGLIKFPAGNDVILIYAKTGETKVGGNVAKLEAPPAEKDGTVFLPLGPVLKMFGISFTWDGTGDFELATQKDRIIASFTKADLGFYYGGPLVRDGFVYIGSSNKVGDDAASDNAFFKLDKDLKEVWEYPLASDEVRGTADMDADGNIYFTVLSGHVKGSDLKATLSVYSLDNTGKLRWKAQVIPQGGVPDVWPMEVTVGKYLYVMGDAFYALDLKTGKTIAKTAGPNKSSKPLLGSNGDVYVESGNTAWCFTAEGKLVWKFEPKGDKYLSEAIYSVLAFQPGEKNVVMISANWVYDMDAATGKLVWKFDTGLAGGTRCQPMVDAQGNIYYGTKNDNHPCTARAVKADGSGLLWKTEGFGEQAGSMALGDAGLVYFGTEQLIEKNNPVRFHALGIATGKVVWELILDTDVTSSPAFGADGTLYFATMTGGKAGSVFALDCDSTGPLAGAADFQLTE